MVKPTFNMIYVFIIIYISYFTLKVPISSQIGEGKGEHQTFEIRQTKRVFASEKMKTPFTK